MEGDIRQYHDETVRGYDIQAPLVYNKAMRWIGPAEGLEGAVLAYVQGRDIPLTGARQAASWLLNRQCTMTPLGPTMSRFTRPNDLDGPDVAALPCLQWPLRQQPILEYALIPHAGPCWLQICLPDSQLGEGLEIFRTPATEQPRRGRVDLQAIFEQRGLGFHQFGEIALYVYQERPADRTARSGSADIELRLVGKGALITTPPLVRTEAQARAGFPIYALVVGPEGELLSAREASVTALIGRQRRTMTQKPGQRVFSVRLQGLPRGDHVIVLEAKTRSGQYFRQTLAFSVVPGEYVCSRPGHVAYEIAGKPIPTLLGDLYSWAPLLDATSPQRRLILMAEEWRSLTPEEQKRVGLIKQRTLTEAEIRQQLAAHAANGFGVIRLALNVSWREFFLDAGGHIAMPGLETLAVILRECRRHNLKALLNLFHYPYGSLGTGGYAPWQAYIEAGWQGTQSFTDPKIWPLLTGYLRELLVFLRDDPALLGYSLTGENDQIYGAEFINKLYDFVKSCDPNHLITLEQGGGLQHCPGGVPWTYEAFRPAASGGVGYRTYYTEGMPSDAYFMICARFYRGHPPAFLAEVASGPGWYGHFAKTWMHPDFITKVRDNCWASVLTQQTMCLTWSAPWTQEERLVPAQCLALLDWTHFQRARPPVGLLVRLLDRGLIRRLAAYEAALAKIGIDYDYVWENRDDPKRHPLVLDAREEYVEPKLPPEIFAQRPVMATGDYSVSYLLDATHRQMLAYVRNTAEYRLDPGYGVGVQEWHRQRMKTSTLQLKL